MCVEDSALRIGVASIPIRDVDSVQYVYHTNGVVAFVGGMLVGDLIGFAIATPISKYDCKNANNDVSETGSDRGWCQAGDMLAISGVSGISVGVASLMYFGNEHVSNVQVESIRHCQSVLGDDITETPHRKFKGIQDTGQYLKP